MAITNHTPGTHSTSIPYTIGDVVVLKSGGPRMTVEYLGHGKDGQPFVYCKWFDANQKIETATFSPATLEKV